jgi:hypothetical protein
MDFANDNDDDDDQGLLALPAALRPVVRLARHVEGFPWFAALGQPVGLDEEADAVLYGAGLGFDPVHVAVVETWGDAALLTAELESDAETWDIEEQIRADLLAVARDTLDEAELGLALTAVATKAAFAAREGALAAAQAEDEIDEALIDQAVEAAALTARLAALALAADADEDHPFLLKLRLYEAGRWPLGLVGQTLHLF